jgi:hypothetical protein
MPGAIADVHIDGEHTCKIVLERLTECSVHSNVNIRLLPCLDAAICCYLDGNSAVYQQNKSHLTNEKFLTNIFARSGRSMTVTQP